MIAHASYVMCDGPCGGNPAPSVVDGAKEARREAARHGFARTEDGRDLCPVCVDALKSDQPSTTKGTGND